MANQITGKIRYIYPTQQVITKDGKPFQRRSLVLDTTRFDPYTGERGFENTPMLDFLGEQCNELDRYKVGQVVTISFDVQGTRYRNADGVEQIFTRVRPYRIELRQSPARPYTQQSSGVAQTTQLQMDYANNPSAQASNTPQQAPAQPYQQTWEPPQPSPQPQSKEDGLPF